MRISDDLLDAVKAATDIVDLIGERTRLKKQGARFVGLCPFHNEKSPSFSVDPVQGLYHCFGCKASGDAIRFVEHVENVPFSDAVRLLATRAGIALPEDDADAEADPREAVYHALRFAARFYYRQLTQTDAGRKRALAYVEQRGFTPETVKAFGLGYAPDAWDALLRAADEAQIKPDVLEAAGLVLPRRQGGGHYDRFRDRLVFPILSPAGKVLGFGGRVLSRASDQPKYINSPETSVYDKSRVLYGLYHARQAIRSEEEAILVEGYTDVIALHQAGVEHVVAASGTALTAHQVEELKKRKARRLVLLFDADSAGLLAARRSVDIVLQAGLAAYVVVLPEAADPDSFVRQFGGDAFRKYVRDQRQSFVSFLVDQARNTGRLATPEGLMDTTREVLAAIAHVPSDGMYFVMREGYIRQAAEALGIPDMHLRRQLPDLLRETSDRAERRHEAPAQPAEPAREDARARADEPAMRPEEELLLRLMLEHGLPMVEFVLGHLGEQEFTEGPVREAVHHLIAQYQEDRIDPAAFTSGAYGPDVQRLVAGVLVERHTLSRNWERQHGIRVSAADPRAAAADAMTYLKLGRVDEAIRQTQRRLFTAERDGADQTPHLETLTQLHQLRRAVERRAFLHA